jgi:hypothetical protein
MTSELREVATYVRSWKEIDGTYELENLGTIYQRTSKAVFRDTTH